MKIGRTNLRNRAWRRHQYLKRVKRAREKYLYSSWEGRFLDEEFLEKAARIEADTHTRCSCDMCGNPRKHFHKETRQEKEAELNQIEQEACVESVAELGYN